MNAPIPTDTFTRPSVVDKARLTARRLRAASVRGNWVTRRRAAELHRWLQRARRMNERAIVTGPHAQWSALAAFLRDYGPAIESECQWAARRVGL